jgi:hypothetical protein
LPTFTIGTPFANTGVTEIRQSLEKDRPLAALSSIILLPEIARNNNSSGDGKPKFDEDVARKVDGLSKTTLTPSAEARLIIIPGLDRTHEVLQFEQVEADEDGIGCSDADAWDVVQESTQASKDPLNNSPDWDDDGMFWEDGRSLLVNTR